uniref:Uncharacterized protein ycf23 n=1 Tax=Chondria sp. (in: red algae) TaxID=1982705 RepID=A0A1Z1MR72_9FLOR|nr:hypothetical protein [Chondria sp. (in: red algae)]
MNLFRAELCKSFESQKVIKLITGIDNLDISNILSMVKAAELSGVTYLDIVANTKVVQLLKSISSLPICASSISPIELYNCVIAGADLVEIGNFDFCYRQGIYLTSLEILSLVKEVRSLVGNVDICVTIPYYMSFYEQIKLAQDLEFLNVNILQTESVFTENKLAASPLLNNNIFNSLSPSCLSLLSTYLISSNVQLPIITSSSINNLSSPLALSLGASGVGIGSKVKQQVDITRMANYLKSLHYLMNSMNLKILSKSNNQFKDLLFNIVDSYSIDIMV